LDTQDNYPVPQQSSYRIIIPIFDRVSRYLFLSLIGPPPPPPLGLMRVNLELVYGEIPTLCPQNLQINSGFGTLQIAPKLQSDRSRCSWFFSAPLANRVFFSLTLRPNSCTAIQIMSPSSGEKWVLNADSTPWLPSFINSSLPNPQRSYNSNIVPITFANWEGNAVITAFTPYRYPACQNSDNSEKIQLSWQSLFAEGEVSLVQVPENQITLDSNVYKITTTLRNLPSTNSTSNQFERNLWLNMTAGQTVTFIAKDSNTGSAFNRLSTAPVPVIMVANSRIPTTFDHDFHNWPGILSPVRQQLQESLTITAPSSAVYFFSILGGTILYDAPETLDIFVVQGSGSFENCWDDKNSAIKPLDV
jgi:hypothetical protein